MLNLETIVGGYIRGQLITSTLIAVFMFVVLFSFGVPNNLRYFDNRPKDKPSYLRIHNAQTLIIGDEAPIVAFLKAKGRFAQLSKISTPVVPPPTPGGMMGGPPGAPDGMKGGPPGGPGRGGMGGPDLTKVGAEPEHTKQWITDHVRNPKAHKPQSRMPASGPEKISDSDLSALADYLASRK